MARGLQGAMESAVEATEVRPFVLIDLMFSSPIYLWSGYGELSYTNTYLPRLQIRRMVFRTSVR